MKASEICEEAARLVSHDRRKQYGPPAENLGRTALLWSCYLGKNIDAVDVAAMMVLLKLARLQHERKVDTAVDAAGYSAIIGELITDSEILDDRD